MEKKQNITPSLSVWYPIVHHQVSQMRATKFWRHIPGGFNHMSKWSYKREEMIQLIGNDNFYPTCFPEIRQSHRSFFGSTKTKKSVGISLQQKLSSSQKNLGFSWLSTVPPDFGEVPLATLHQPQKHPPFCAPHTW